jgi:hypothetical protein
VIVGEMALRSLEITISPSRQSKVGAEVGIGGLVLELEVQAGVCFGITKDDGGGRGGLSERVDDSKTTNEV